MQIETIERNNKKILKKTKKRWHNNLLYEGGLSRN